MIGVCDVDPIAQENYAEGRADEREAIVAWLRQQTYGLAACWIERGEHITRSPGV